MLMDDERSATDALTHSARKLAIRRLEAVNTIKSIAASDRRRISSRFPALSPISTFSTVSHGKSANP
jgi:hypothetical protein